MMTNDNPFKNKRSHLPAQKLAENVPWDMVAIEDNDAGGDDNVRHPAITKQAIPGNSHR